MSLADDFVHHHVSFNQIGEKRAGDVLATLSSLEATIHRPAEEATPADVRAWMQNLLDAGNAPTTVAWRLSAAKPFFRWLRREKVIEPQRCEDLTEVEPPRGAGQGKPRPYSRKELIAFWRAVDERYPKTTENYLKRYARGTSRLKRVRSHCMHAQIEAIVKLALYCGLRRNEIFVLTIEEMHPDNAYLVVHGKRVDQRPKVRQVPYSAGAREAVVEWFACRRLLAPLNDSPWIKLGGNNDLEPMTRGIFEHLLYRLDGGWAYHRFRHTCATERLRAGMNLEALRDFLGHANIQQTLGYARLLSDDIARSIDDTEEAFDRAVRRAA